MLRHGWNVTHFRQRLPGERILVKSRGSLYVVQEFLREMCIGYLLFKLSVEIFQFDWILFFKKRN